MQKQQHTPSTVMVSDEDGSQHRCLNGNVLADIFANSPVYRRETPPETIAPDLSRIGYEANGERIVRVFGDYESALARMEDIWGTRDQDTLKGLLADRYKPVLGATKAAEALFDRVQREVPIETLRSQMEASVCGGSPRIGAYLANEPLSMNRFVSQLNEQGAIRVFYDLSTSASTASDTVLGRGVAALALVTCLQQVRPVELWITTSGTARSASGGQCHTLFGLRLSTAPLDLSVASRALADYRMRNFLYRGEMRMIGAGLHEPSRLAWSPIPYAVKCGATPNDIVIGPHKEGEKNSVSPTHSPVDWIKRELELWLTNSGNSAAMASLG